MFKGVVTGRILGLEHGSRVRSYSTGELGRSKRFERIAGCEALVLVYGIREARRIPEPFVLVLKSLVAHDVLYLCLVYG
jgi:hypothetical protein